MSRFVSSVLVCCLLALPSIGWSKSNPKATPKTVTKTPLQAIPTIESLKKQCLATKGVVWNGKTSRCELNRQPLPKWPVIVAALGGVVIMAGAVATIVVVSTLPPPTRDMTVSGNIMINR